MELFDQIYEGQHISFDFHKKNVMVNATEMAKVFGKKISHFMENESTKSFIAECLKSRNSGFLNIENQEDLFISKQKSGTWMHRVLALKFAAWLNPSFELWVYITIDKILFEHFRRIEESLKSSARRRLRIENLRNSLHTNPEYLELIQLELEERQAAYQRGKSSKQQLTNFKNMFEEEE